MVICPAFCLFGVVALLTCSSPATVDGTATTTTTTTTKAGVVAAAAAAPRTNSSIHPTGDAAGKLAVVAAHSNISHKLQHMDARSGSHGGGGGGGVVSGGVGSSSSSSSSSSNSSSSSSTGREVGPKLSNSAADDRPHQFWLLATVMLLQSAAVTAGAVLWPFHLRDVYGFGSGECVALPACTTTTTLRSTHTRAAPPSH